MIDTHLSPAWHAVALGFGNHLWQSTLVAGAAALLALALRKHHARARYWIWLAASIKFLVPFSLLVAVGSHLAWQRHSAETTRPALYFAIEEIGQPFTPAAARVASDRAATLNSISLMHLLPWTAAVWLAGFLIVVLAWSVRWRRIAAAMKSASPSSEGRELTALRRIERIRGIRTPIALLLSEASLASLEPGIFGIARPALIWPQGISPRLEDAHLEAILAHEVWHVRRRDNLAAVVHMVVEAVFWFHPLVWWLGARLVEERERACDEQVVAWGSDPQVYAESILKVCEFCLRSPLPCVSGVTGADLKKRMVRIMSHRMLHNLDFARKAVLTAAVVCAIAIPITVGLLSATPSRPQSQDADASLSAWAFSSVSVKQSEPATPNAGNTSMFFDLNHGTFVARGVTLRMLIQTAYHVQDAQISGGPDLLSKSKFDIDAKFDPAFVADWRQQTSDHKDFDAQVQAAMKSLLTSRFKLAAHFETRNVDAFDLVPDAGGAKLQASGIEPSMVHFDQGELSSAGAPLELLITQLSARLGRPVVDKTGLKGNYAFHLHWTPDPTEDEHDRQAGQPVGPEPPAQPNGPSLMTALQEQLGLKLEPKAEPVQVLVIDHAELPAAE